MAVRGSYYAHRYPDRYFCALNPAAAVRQENKDLISGTDSLLYCFEKGMSAMRNSNQKNYNRQMAEGYIMYMMAGSYLKTAKPWAAAAACFCIMRKCPVRSSTNMRKESLKQWIILMVIFLGNFPSCAVRSATAGLTVSW